MRLGFKSIWRQRLNISLVLTILWSGQVVYAQVEYGDHKEIEPLDSYALDCAPRDHSYAETFYSASSKDLYEINRHLGNTYFRVYEFINTADDGQFLKGHFYNANITTRPMGLPIPEDRIDKYRREEDGFREIWFVRSNQWLCSFDYETREWLRRMWEEKLERWY